MEVYNIQHEELLERQILGSGAFGAVYKAIWRELRVAVKYFNHKAIGDDPSSKREIEVLRLLKSLKHRNIVNLFGMGSHGPQSFMVMELAPFSLEHVLHECKTKYDYYVDHVMSWSLQLAQALKCCHKLDIVHRDIKPPNILLFDEGRHLKVCDFGTAKLLENATSASTFIGTSYYLAPEIMEGKHKYKCDIYSFGITLWEMVTRHKPTLDLNQKEKPHQYQVFKLIGEGKRLPTIVGIPCFLWDMITRCWSHNPEERPPAAMLELKLNSIINQYFEREPPLIDITARHQRSKTELHLASPSSNRAYQRVISHPPDKVVISFYAESLQVDLTDDDSFQDDTVVDEPHQADCNSRCYIEDLSPQDQPFIPLEHDEESVRLYNEYCSYMKQNMKILEELQQMEDHKNQVINEIENEERRQTISSTTYQRYQSLLEENEKLSSELSQLKQND